MKKVAISIGDLNGIGIQLALNSHNKIKRYVNPVYVIDKRMLKQASKLLKVDIPKDFHTISPKAPYFQIKPAKVSKKSGFYSFKSFQKAIELAHTNKVDAICTLPIHKKAWESAGVSYKGHTDALRDIFDSEAIMMLGCPQMYVALYTEHIPLKSVASQIDVDRLVRFFCDFYQTAKPTSQVAVLGLNPHAGDSGVLGDEEIAITQAIDIAHKELGSKEIFTDPMVPDVAFIPRQRERYRYYIAMYHDQGLTPLKALHFDESINISLNLPILRTSVDHGTAFDIAYTQQTPDATSYINALEYIRESLS